MNGARPCVTSLAALVHGGECGSPRDGGAEVSEEWVAGRTVRCWAACGGCMTQYIDLSLVGRVRGGGARGAGGVGGERESVREGARGWGPNKIHAIRQIYALLRDLSMRGLLLEVSLVVVAARRRRDD